MRDRLRRGLCLLGLWLALGLPGSVPASADDALLGPPETRAAQLRISAVGDIMLGGSAGPELAMLGYDYPFVKVGPLLRESQVVFGNLEGPLTHGGEAAEDKQFVFRSPPDKVIPSLKRAGFNVMSLANNHSLDYGWPGLQNTLDALDGAGIARAGAGRDLAEARRPAIVRVEGWRVAVLAYSNTFPESFYAEDDRPGTAFGHEDHVREDVAKALKQADIVLVSFHWGQEGKTELRDYQRLLGRAAIDAGAHAVLGHHPHILQGIEVYRGRPILYSLGNFAFGSYSRTATRSAIAYLVFDEGRLTRLELLPVNVDNVELNFQTAPLEGAEASAVIAGLQALSRPLGTTIEARAGRGLVHLAR